MVEDTLHHICIIFINGKSSLYQVTGIELDEEYFKIAKDRIEKHKAKK